MDLLKMWCLILIVFLLYADVGSGLYFPMGNVELSVPGGQEIWPSRDIPLAVLKALPDHGKRHQESAYVNYTSNLPTELLDVGRKTGELKLRDFVKKNNETTKVALFIMARDLEGNEAETRVQVELDQDALTDCEVHTKQLCFWKNVTYRLYENRGPTVLGSLSSPFITNMCPKYKVRYQLLNGTKFMTIVKSKSQLHQWNLKSLKPFERDIFKNNHTSKLFGVGAKVYLGIKCVVTSPGGTQREVPNTLSIEVLDENDNPPTHYEKSVIHVYTNNGFIEKSEMDKISKNINFIDRDSPPVNNHTYKLLDKKQLFNLRCRDFEEDRAGEPQTFITCGLALSENFKFTEDYTVILQINDTSMLPRSQKSVVNTTINFHTSPPPTSPPSKQSPMLYNNVTIFRSAAPFARVIQPQQQDLESKGLENAKFKMKYSSENEKAFNITESQGIVYVQNVGLMKHLPGSQTLEVEWKDPKTGEIFSNKFHVTITSESTPTCINLGSSPNEWESCSQHENINEKKCIQTCGIGTGGTASFNNNKRTDTTRCVWSGPKIPGDIHSHMYSTCTPDRDTCPDRICDPLEELHGHICPQDCEENILLGAKVNSHTNKGIAVGRGVCTCDGRSCNCKVLDKTKKTTTKSQSVITTTEITTLNGTIELTSVKTIETNATINAQVAGFKSTNICGKTCMLGIAGSVIFLLGAITVIVVCWRSKKGQRRAQKYVQNVNQLTSLNSDGNDRNGNIHFQPPETLTLSFDMNRSISTNITVPKVMPVDPKWEFPRERLQIEQALGEGQFGRVFRARALDIVCLPGYTTVAVKTLKQDARESELADLMSEYQLLKEVSHPNVIKLLGASTLPGGPVYLIIEYAEYGSLRSYLRRSRHLESEGRIPCSEAMLGTANCITETQLDIQVCPVKPRDILSFAWQISKGMAYLSDMKLVHRDLAARNILLAEGMVCKISDFGLTRDVYEDDNYLKRTRGRVPVKWMAPESLSDHIYNSKSDVWSFGVLLWELVTLGASPYPGIAVQNLYHLLKSGYRMEKPENCSPALYKMMKCCWSCEPVTRPTFRTLMSKLEAMLADGVDYLDLTPKIVHNRTYFSTIPDALTPDDNEELIGYGNLTSLKPEDINLLSGLDVTKCADLDKMHVWKRPESPKPSNSKYVNEELTLPQELHHYESPIKLRPKNDSPKKQDRPQSYMDMSGENGENQELLNKDSEHNKLTRITSI